MNVKEVNNHICKLKSRSIKPTIRLNELNEFYNDLNNQGILLSASDYETLKKLELNNDIKGMYKYCHCYRFVNGKYILY